MVCRIGFGEVKGGVEVLDHCVGRPVLYVTAEESDQQVCGLEGLCYRSGSGFKVFIGT